jgi:hypothetical protein
MPYPNTPNEALRARALRDMREWLVRLLLRNAAELEAAAFLIAGR